MKRTTSMLILLALLAASAASCGGEATSSDTTAAPSGDTTPTEVTTDDGIIRDELPADLDFGGAETNWLIGDYNAAYLEDFWAEDMNGAVVNDAVYNARKSVEERLNLKIHMEQMSFTYNDRNVYFNFIRQLTLSDDTTYDIVAGYPATSLVTEGGLFHRLNDFKYIDFEKPWWNQDLYSLLPIPDNSLYYLTGDGTLALIKHSGCVFFNQDQLDTLGKKENIYDLVRDGKWTLDKMEEMIADTYQDLNGDTAADPEDFYGVTYGDNNKFRMIPDAFDLQMYTREGNEYKLTLLSERTFDAFDRLQKMVSVNKNSFRPGEPTQLPETLPSFGGNYISKIFAEGRALFSFALVGDAPSIYNSSKFTLGMVPYPKFDEAQDDYYTAAQRMGYFYVPASVREIDRVGAVLEAWSSECYRNVMPAYFETSLKARYSTDSDMAEMFDLLRRNARVTVGTCYSTGLSINCDIFKNANNPDYNFVSDMESKRQAVEAALVTMTEQMAGLAGK